MTEPHYVRFARALALASTLGGVAGCGASTTLPESDAAAGNDAASVSDAATLDDAAIVADAGSDVDAFFDCTTCTCGLTADDAGVPFCSGQATLTCGCAAVGPLAPPDLPALA